MRTVLAFMAVVVVWALVALFISPANAATFRHVNDSVVEYSGKVDDKDQERLINYMKQYPNTKTIVMDSEGGHAVGGYKLGYAIRYYDMQTVVPFGNKCLSACATAFLGGTTKALTGILGFHVSWVEANIETNDALKQGQYLGHVDSGYLFDMGYRNQFATLIAQVTSSDTFFIIYSLDELSLFDMVDYNFNAYEDLPQGFVANGIAGPLRLALMIQGH